MPYKIVLAGTPEFAAHIFAPFIEKYKQQVVAIYTQPDRQSGRGRHVTPPPVKELALQHNIPIFQPENFKLDSTYDKLAALQPDIMVVVAYGIILPQRVLDIPKLGCINVHASLLPKLRGAAPIQQSILQGFTQTGISIMQLVRAMDAGPVFVTAECNIEKTDTSLSLTDKLYALGTELLLDNIDKILTKQLPLIEQDHSSATFAPKFNKTDAELNWQQPADYLERLIRASNPWPIAYTNYQNNYLRIYQAAVLVNNTNQEYLPGTIINVSPTGLNIAAGNNTILQIQKLQLAGGKILSVKDILNSKKITFVVGQRFL